MSHRESLSVGAPAYTGPPTLLRAVLAGEHAARAVDWLLAWARSDPTGRLVLDMPRDEARSLVRFADACCDWIDKAPELQEQEQERDRDAQLSAPDAPCPQRGSHLDEHVERYRNAFPKERTP